MPAPVRAQTRARARPHMLTVLTVARVTFSRTLLRAGTCSTAEYQALHCSEQFGGKIKGGMARRKVWTLEPSHWLLARFNLIAIHESLSVQIDIYGTDRY